MVLSKLQYHLAQSATFVLGSSLLILRGRHDARFEMMAKGQLNALIYYQVSITDKEGRFDQILHSSVHEGAKFFSL